MATLTAGSRPAPKPTSPAERARHTDRWTEIILRALTAKVAKRWRFVSFRGAGGGEWRGIVDVIAIRKTTSQPLAAELRRGDLLELILIQMKGGAAKRSSRADRERLARVAKAHRAKAVVLFEWARGRKAAFSTLNKQLEWESSSCLKIFGA